MLLSGLCQCAYLIGYCGSWSRGTYQAYWLRRREWWERLVQAVSIFVIGEMSVRKIDGTYQARSCWSQELLKEEPLVISLLIDVWGLTARTRGGGKGRNGSRRCWCLYPSSTTSTTATTSSFLDAPGRTFGSGCWRGVGGGGGASTFFWGKPGCWSQ